MPRVAIAKRQTPRVAASPAHHSTQSSANSAQAYNPTLFSTNNTNMNQGQPTMTTESSPEADEQAPMELDMEAAAQLGGTAQKHVPRTTLAYGRWQRVWNEFCDARYEDPGPHGTARLVTPDRCAAFIVQDLWERKCDIGSSRLPDGSKPGLAATTIKLAVMAVKQLWTEQTEAGINDSPDPYSPRVRELIKLRAQDNPQAARTRRRKTAPVTGASANEATGGDTMEAVLSTEQPSVMQPPQSSANDSLQQAGDQSQTPLLSKIASLEQTIQRMEHNARMSEMAQQESKRRLDATIGLLMHGFSDMCNALQQYSNFTQNGVSFMPMAPSLGAQQPALGQFMPPAAVAPHTLSVQSEQPRSIFSTATPQPAPTRNTRIAPVGSNPAQARQSATPAPIAPSTRLSQGTPNRQTPGATTLHQASSIANPLEKDRYKVKTVAEAWREWHVGSEEYPSIASLNEQYGLENWCTSPMDRKFYYKRKAIIDAIDEVAALPGIANVEQAIEAMEQLRGELSLNQFRINYLTPVKTVDWVNFKRQYGFNG